MSSLLGRDIKPYQLSTSILKTWRKFIASNDSFSSPYFNPAYTLAVAQVRDDVEIALLYNFESQLIGIFPYQRLTPHTACPVGGRMTDYFGLISSEPVKFEMDWFLDALGIHSFDFHGLSVGQELFEPYRFDGLESYEIDLSQGLDRYLRWAHRNSSTIKRQSQKTRAIERTIGPLRFEFDCKDRNLLNRLIQLKREKYQQTQTFDILSVDWSRKLIEQIFDTDNDDFRGMMSVLWAGDEMVAAHLGMINDNVLHYWFPVFDPEFSRYSPGTILILETIRSACARKIQRIDMTFGFAPFKPKFCNIRSTVLQGRVDMNVLRHSLLRKRYNLRNKLKSMPMKGLAKMILRKFYPSYGKWHFK